MKEGKEVGKEGKLEGGKSEKDRVEEMYRDGEDESRVKGGEGKIRVKSFAVKIQVNLEMHSIIQ